MNDTETTTTTETTELEVCPDCLIWAANADCSGFCDCETIEEHDAHPVIVAASKFSHIWAVDNGGAYRFSRTPCELCKRPDAGHRYPIEAV